MNNLNIFKYYREFYKLNYAMLVNNKKFAKLNRLFSGRRVPIFLYWITGAIKLVDRSEINSDDVTMTNDGNQ